MFYIIYLMLFFKINIPYIKLSLLNIMRNSIQAVDILIVKKFLSLQLEPRLIPFIHYNIYTFYEQG